MKIWHYRQLSDEEFKKNLNDVTKKFKDCEYDTPEHFIHVIALLIYFSKKQLCQLSIEEIRSQVNTCINNKYQNNQNWKNRLFQDCTRFNGTGLSYMGGDDEDFREVFAKIKDKNETIYKEEENNKLDQLLKQFLESIKSLDEDFLTDLLLDKYKQTPIFNQLNTTEFVNILTNIENKNISRLSEILGSRYNDYYYINHKLSYSLTDELDFWKTVNIELSTFLKSDKSSKTLKTLLLHQFNKYLKENIIENLESC